MRFGAMRFGYLLTDYEGIKEAMKYTRETKRLENA
jgi:hypothetical protein